MQGEYKNPFRPGAGHMPLYLAGRAKEIGEFSKLLSQETILDNLVLTGLRGVGKTVLLENFKPIAIRERWLWVGTDLSESASLSEENIAIRLITDLSVVTSNILVGTHDNRIPGFVSSIETVPLYLNFNVLLEIYKNTPGLVIDKLKNTLQITWEHLKPKGSMGIIFAYDEAQNLSDHRAKEQYPLSLLLDLFQSIQRQRIPFMLIFTGLPTLFPKLVEARTYAERMFHLLFLHNLNEQDSKDAILKPIESSERPIKLSKEWVQHIIKMSGGYPYFIQFIGREVYDVALQKFNAGEKLTIPTAEIMRKLDADFFSGRWAKATDRQRELLTVIAQLQNADLEFTVQEIVELSIEKTTKPFSNSHVNQMLSSLSNTGLVYKNRFGKYSFAVPLLGQFILRQLKEKNTRMFENKE